MSVSLEFAIDLQEAIQRGGMQLQSGTVCSELSKPLRPKGPMPLLFNSLLHQAEIPPGDVRLLRHQDNRATKGRTP